MTDDLAEFLLARIAEDEAAAREATVLDGAYPDGYEVEYNWCRVVTNAAERSNSVENLIGIRAPSPDRVLAECEAKRRIVAAYLDERTRRDIYWQADESDMNDDDRHRRQSTTARTRGLEIAVEALALPYADHPDWREEWRP